MRAAHYLWLLLIVGAVGGGAYYYINVMKQPAYTAQSAAAPARPAAPVETALVETGRVTDEVESLGTLSANERVVIAPETAGRIIEIAFGEGDRVEKGQVLVRFDTSVQDAELQQAKADVSLADDTYERARSLAQRGTGTQVRLEEAAAQRDAARAKLALAQARLEKLTLTAPFDGVVGLRTTSVGNFVAVGENLVTLTDIDPIKVDFRVPELFLRQLKPNQRVEVSVDALPGRKFDGEVYAIDPIVDVNGRAIRLRAQIPNQDLALKPGLFARVKITVDTREGALMIPESAIIPGAGGKAVYAVDDGKVRLRPITIGKRMAGKVEVVEGLSAGMRIVTAGQMRLRDGSPIEVMPVQAELKR